MEVHRDKSAVSHLDVDACSLLPIEAKSWGKTCLEYTVECPGVYIRFDPLPLALEAQSHEDKGRTSALYSRVGIL